MRRRAALAALTGSLSALAGCNTLDRGGGTDRPAFDVAPRTEDHDDPNDADAYDDGPPADPSDAVTVDGVRRRLSVFDRADAEPFAYDVGLLPRDDGGPVRLWVALTNRSDAEREVEFDGAVPFGAPIGIAYEPEEGVLEPAPDGPRLFLVPTSDPAFETVRPGDPDTGCWRASADVNGVGYVRSVTVDPGATVGQVFELLTPPSTDGCLPPATYRFETADGRAGFFLAVRRVRAGGGPPASVLTDVALPVLESETSWFHDARAEDAAVYLEPAAETAAAAEAVTFTLRNDGDRPVTVVGHELFRSNGTAWLPVASSAVTLSGNREFVPVGGARAVEVGFGRYGDDVTLDELRAGYYAVRLRLAEAGSDPAAAVHVTDGTDPELTRTDTVEATTEEPDGTLRVRTREYDPSDPGVLTAEATGAGDATSVPLELVLRFPALRNSLSFLDGVDRDRVRLLTGDHRVDPAVVALPGSESSRAVVRFRGETYTVRAVR
ncbi:hypothetical protein [Haloarchaeobius iranensis]|uniref:Lipoprotein n=1 Tax=Haloarchaeobius iranensis TaxID=996166 RepID=A0A1G9WFD7_9EURY|nr:hypothetical protein [Haloarchaeobius iranensis]SDM83017.1 hypothetical protein SAMN05192554_10833 [Haloarchaeobius iranensis]